MRSSRVATPLLVLLLALALLAPGTSSQAAPSVPAGAPVVQASTGATTSVSKQVQRLAKQRLTKQRVIKHRAKRCVRLQRAGRKHRASQCRRAVQRVKTRNAKILRARAATAAAAAAAKAPAPVAPPVLTPGTADGVVRLANANIKFGHSAASFNADLAQVIRTAPDFVTLNEAGPRSALQLTPAGYAHYKPAPSRINGNAVLWRTDRWTKAAEGYRVIVDDGPMKYDKNRGASFVTLDSTTGEGRLSVISTHHMQNPAKLGPNKPLRQRLYATGMARLRTLVTQLSAEGPVFIAGDFNSGFRTFDTWSPRAQFAPIGVKAAMESMPVVPTHDGGGIIDYVFYQAAKAQVLSQTVSNLRSDHHMMVNDFQLIPEVVSPLGR